MKKLENANQPAFPINEEESDRIEQDINIYTGLTKRKYIATKILSGLLTSVHYDWSDNRYIDKSISIADDLLYQLSRK